MNVIFGLILVVLILFFLKSSLGNNQSNNNAGKTTHNLSINWDEIDDEFVVFDIETTGLPTNKSAVDIVEIGALKVNKNDLINGVDAISFQALLTPHRGVINSEASRINGITQSMINRDGESAEKVMREFVEFVGKRKLIAYNVSFDRWCLRRELAHWGIKHRSKYECAYELAKEVFDGMPNYKLSTVAKSLGIKNPQAHRVLGDCLTTLWVYLVAKSK